MIQALTLMLAHCLLPEKYTSLRQTNNGKGAEDRMCQHENSNEANARDSGGQSKKETFEAVDIGESMWVGVRRRASGGSDECGLEVAG